MRSKKSETKIDDTKDNDKKPKGTKGDPTIKDYLKYIKYLEDHNWHKDSIILHDLNTRLAIINNIKANSEGTVVDIQCPPGLLICISGINNYPENYHIEKIPYFEIKLGNSNGEEIDPNTKIKIFKRKILHKDEELCELEYREISMTNFGDSPNLYKHQRELFRFKNSVELRGEDHLKFVVINPNIDIDNVKFNLGLDILTPRD